MKFVFTDKKVTLPASVHAYAEKKVGKLDRYFSSEAEAAITFSVEKDRNRAEVTVRSGSMILRASESTSDMRASIDAAVSTIERQIRKNKARRAYEHALRLRGMGFDTPEPVAWSEYRKDGLIADTYFVSRRSELTPLPQTMKQFPAPDTLPVLEAFARFTVRLHEQGICHEDFNQTNILWEYDGTTGSYRFQLIDINRMRFHARPLRPDECMINLRRLSCPAVPFLYILDRYADIRGWDINDTLLRGVFFRLLFGRRQQFKKRFRKRKSAAAGKKQG